MEERFNNVENIKPLYNVFNSNDRQIVNQKSNGSEDAMGRGDVGERGGMPYLQSEV